MLKTYLVTYKFYYDGELLSERCSTRISETPYEEEYSGADFDGDAVMVIPTHDPAGKVKITSTPKLKGLEDFDPKMSYPERAGMKYMKDPKTGKDSTQMQMGLISNLITDMTLGGRATDEELARAVRHSMVVIDAGKHKLDYKRSEIENNIAELRNKYQRTVDADGNLVKTGGASTILSRAKGEVSVLKRQGSPKVNMRGTEWYDPSRPEGALIYKNADDVNYEVRKVNKRTGEVTITTKQKHQQSTKMAETDDAMSLVSPAKHPMEIAYADYANSMKALANQARKEMVTTGKIATSKAAKETYAPEVKSLMEKLDEALKNSPRERAALREANAVVNAKVASDPTMKKADIKKESQRALSSARINQNSVKRRDRNIDITDREWAAIQAGAISESNLKKILNNTDVDKLKQRAMPRASNSLTTAQINRVKALAASNYTLEEIAKKFGKSTSAISAILKGGN